MEQGKDQQHLSVLQKKKKDVTLNVEQAFDMEQPKDVEFKDVEQAQRGGTGPKINHTFSAGVGQAQRYFRGNF